MTSRLAIAPGTPVERVWAVLTDVRLMPRLHPQVLEVTALDGSGELTTGARFATVNRLTPG